MNSLLEIYESIKRKKNAWQALFWLLLMVFSVLFLMPAEYLVDNVFDWWDKAQHTLAFIIFTLTANLSYKSNSGLILLSLIVYGGVIEIIQSMTGWRQGELGDWFADVLGVVFSSLYLNVYRKPKSYI